MRRSIIPDPEHDGNFFIFKPPCCVVHTSEVCKRGRLAAGQKYLPCQKPDPWSPRPASALEEPGSGHLLFRSEYTGMGVNHRLREIGTPTLSQCGWTQKIGYAYVW